MKKSLIVCFVLLIFVGCASQPKVAKSFDKQRVKDIANKAYEELK